MNKHYGKKLFLLTLITNAHCFACTQESIGGKLFENCPSDEHEPQIIHEIKQLLKTDSTGQALKTYCKYMDIKPLHIAVRNNHSELIEPLVCLSFNPNEVDDYQLEPFWYAIQHNQIQRDTIKELIRCGAHYRTIKFVNAISKCALRTYCCSNDISEENIMLLLDPKAHAEWFDNAIFKENFYNPIIKLLRKACEAGWKTKTWRRVAESFLMASHHRTGSMSPARLLCPIPRLFQYIADNVPTHMDMHDRWARRARKTC